MSDCIFCNILAGQSPVAADVTLAKDAPQEVVVAAVRGWLERHHWWLLLFDNARSRRRWPSCCPVAAPATC